MKLILGIVIVCMLLFSAFFSGAEISFATCNKFRLKKTAESGSRRAKLAEYINEHYSASLSTILVGNNLVNIAASSAATLLVVDLAIPQKDLWVTIVMTCLLLIFGEIVPKNLCNDYADPLVLVFARPLRFMMRLFYLVVKPVELLVDFLARIWKRDEAPAVTQDELYTALEEIEDEGGFSESESEIIKSALEFTDITAHEIMIPRVDCIAFDIADGVEGILNNPELLHFSRFPVYRDSIDTVLGILPVKRLLKACAESSPENVSIEDLLYPPVFVHKTMSISAIINTFRRIHAQMAIVVDEYGGTMGILTMEDIVEEIVGEIFDESDSPEEEAIKRSVDSFEVDGTMNLYDMFDLIGYEPSEEFVSEYNTVGGWMTEQLDRFPQKGDSFTYDGITLTCLEAQSVRVDSVMVHYVALTGDDD